MLNRRRFLKRAGLAAVATAAAPLAGCAAERSWSAEEPAPPPADYGTWEGVRAAFALSPDRVHLSAMLLAANPRPVREAIERHRRGLDADPAGYYRQHSRRLRAEVREEAARYLGGAPGEIALTDSTTMGIATVYHGLRLGPGDEVLTTEHDYYATHEALRLAAARTGAVVRRVRLFDDPATATAEEMVERLGQAVTPRTRALALTWVHSSTGLKLPVAALREAADDAARRHGSPRPLLALDAVHGFGVEDVDVRALGCDFLMAGCHKWLFGPRGTGIVWAHEEAWAATEPTIPSFIEGASWEAWDRAEPPPGPTNAERMTPGGFKPFEHRWAMTEAFRFHQAIGKERVQARTHALATQLKDGLAAMPHVRLHTPRDAALSSGVVCFDVDGLAPAEVVHRLAALDIIASVTPYAVPHARLTPCVYNTEGEVEAALRAVHALT